MTRLPPDDRPGQVPPHVRGYYAMADVDRITGGRDGVLVGFDEAGGVTIVLPNPTPAPPDGAVARFGDPLDALRAMFEPPPAAPPPKRRGGRKSRFSEDIRRDLAERACRLTRGGLTWDQARANLGSTVPTSTLYRWHRKLLSCSSCGT